MQISDGISALALMVSFWVFYDTRRSRSDNKEISALRFIGELNNFVWETEHYAFRAKELAIKIHSGQATRAAQNGVQKSIDACELMMRNSSTAREYLEPLLAPGSKIVPAIPHLMALKNILESARKEFEMGVAQLESAESTSKRELMELAEKYGNSQVATAITAQAKLIDEKLGFGPISE